MLAAKLVLGDWSPLLTQLSPLEPTVLLCEGIHPQTLELLQYPDSPQKPS